MNIKTEKEFIDACHLAKAIVGMMPALPDGLTPRHMRALDAIAQLSSAVADGAAGGETRVSDVADFMRSTRPSVTHLLASLEERGLITKTQSETDRRVFVVALTDTGRDLYQRFVDDYHSHLARLFSAIPEEDVLVATRVMTQAYELMAQDSGRK